MKKRRARKSFPEKMESRLEVAFHTHWVANYDEPIVTQHVFHPTRLWRFDFAFPRLSIAVEIQGYGTGHTSRDGMARDYAKHNEAMKLGWGIIYLMGMHLTPKRIDKTCQYVLHILNTRSNNLRVDNVRQTKPVVRQSNKRRVNNLDEIRRRLREGFDR